MNVVELAKEAGFDKEYFDNQDCPCEECNFLREPLKRFAALVRAEALEEAAKVCDEYYGVFDDDREHGESCAAAIRGLK